MNRICALLVVLGTVVSAPAQAGIFLQYIFGWKPHEVCVIKENNGGGVLRFRYAAEEVNRGDCELVVVDGVCLSNCTFFLNLVDPAKVCVTKWARLGFHIGKPTTYPTIRLATGERGTMTLAFSAPYTGAIAQWVANQGGLTREWKIMYPQTASRIWKWCPRIPTT